MNLHQNMIKSLQKYHKTIKRPIGSFHQKHRTAETKIWRTKNFFICKFFQLNLSIVRAGVRFFFIIFFIFCISLLFLLMLLFFSSFFLNLSKLILFLFFVFLLLKKIWSQMCFLKKKREYRDINKQIKSNRCCCSIRCVSLIK